MDQNKFGAALPNFVRQCVRVCTPYGDGQSKLYNVNCDTELTFHHSRVIVVVMISELQYFFRMHGNLLLCKKSL